MKAEMAAIEARLEYVKISQRQLEARNALLEGVLLVNQTDASGASSVSSLDKVVCNGH